MLKENSFLFLNAHLMAIYYDHDIWLLAPFPERVDQSSESLSNLQKKITYLVNFNFLQYIFSYLSLSVVP